MIQRSCTNCSYFYLGDGCCNAVSFPASDGGYRAPEPGDCCGDHDMKPPTLYLIEIERNSNDHHR